jgi:hypothetical protein
MARRNETIPAGAGLDLGFTGFDPAFNKTMPARKATTAASNRFNPSGMRAGAGH